MATQPHDVELTDEQLAEQNAQAEAEFESGFTGEEDGSAPAPAAAPTPAAPATKAPAAPAPGPAATSPAAKTDPAAPAAAPAPIDPFHGLSKEVKDALAAIPGLVHRNTMAEGRIAALQSELTKLQRSNGTTPPAASPPPAAAKRDKREAVKRDLPEVTDAIDEAMEELREKIAAEKAVAASPPPAATAPQQTEANPRTSEEVTLDEVHPGWPEKLAGTEFNLWLGTQPQQYQDTVRSTGKAAVITAALSKFDAHVDRLASARQQEATLAAERQSRVAGAAAPRKGNARPSAATPPADAEAAFAQGFSAVAGGSA